MQDDIFKYELSFGDLSPEAIAESGQCFRMGVRPDGDVSLIAKGQMLIIRRNKDGGFSFNTTEEVFGSVWKDYFDLDTDYEGFRALIKEDDEFLKTAASFGTGIRILRQEPFEMLISFIISQRKTIPAIRTAIERLCESFGTKRYFMDTDGSEKTFYDFPSPEALAGASETELASCGLGYRLPYVREAAGRCAMGGLSGLEELPTAELIERLMDLKGVGIKVASCVALFAYHRLEVSPVDVWMKRVIDSVYGGSLPEEYAPCAGVIQQYLFNYARMTKLQG
ncbi:MAG TPA: DNA-3-methyladenine glycosylase 2 family protein [Candidatus Avilachnospira avistercoris]|nr:DNA-3-methyladenine glycosylase 2 family protein [Candidatus Avilachnospira avistercoris]